MSSKYSDGEEIRPAGDYRWTTIEGTPSAEIIGWRYADPQPECAESVPDEHLPPSQGGAGQGGLYGMVMGPNGPETRLLESVEDALKRIRDNLDELARLREESASMRAAINFTVNLIKGIQLSGLLTKHCERILAKLQPFTQP